MTTTTITALTAEPSPALADELPIWDVGSGLTKKVTAQNLLNLAVTGGGIVASGGYTLTVPATGTASLLGTAQTHTALKTFSAGINLGNEDLDTYDEGTWTPDLNFGGGNTGMTYSTQAGDYIRIGNCVFWTCEIILSALGSSTGDATIEDLPIAASASAQDGGGQFIQVENLNLSDVIMGYIAAGGTTITLEYIASATGDGTPMDHTDFNGNSQIKLAGFYFV